MTLQSPNIRVRRLLFVEDATWQATGLTMMLEKTGLWEVDVCATPTEALDMLARASNIRNMSRMPSVVSVDLGLSDKPDSPEYGLALLKQIRQRWEGLSIVVHSTLPVKPEVVREVLAHKASYVFLSDDREARAYVALLPFIAQGYLMYSPTPAGQLADVISLQPDPFSANPEYWRTLELLAQNKLYREVAKKESVSERAIMARVRNIAHKLAELEEIPPLPQGEVYKPIVIEWYMKNRFRYGH